MKTAFDEAQWKDEFKRRVGISYEKFKAHFLKATGIPYDHADIRGDAWRLSKWNYDDFEKNVGKLKLGKDGNLISTFDKVVEEWDNNPRTTLCPIEIRDPIFNVLLLVGLTASAQRDTNENVDTGVTHIGTGTDNTAESQSQTGLISAYGSRKAFDVSGQRKVTAQTAKYNMLFSDSDLTVPVTLKEAALYNASVAGTGHARIQYPDFTLSAGQIIVYQVNELMANG